MVQTCGIFSKNVKNLTCTFLLRKLISFINKIHNPRHKPPKSQSYKKAPQLAKIIEIKRLKKYLNRRAVRNISNGVLIISFFFYKRYIYN